VPAAAVIRVPQAIVIINWCKGYVACNNLNYIGVSTILRVGLISDHPKGSANSEGNLPDIIDGEVRRLEERQGLDTPLFPAVNDVDQGLGKTSLDANALNLPPVKYSRKAEIQIIRRLESKRSEACYLIR
jgi:hypothetical protein